MPHSPVENPAATIYRVKNGSPSENMTEVLAMMGGIQSFVGPDDVVVIKPNVQWYNHGASNISAVKTLVDEVFSMRPPFSGEVVLGENTHHGPEPWKRDGWIVPFVRNADCEARNFGELSARLSNTYGERFSVCHWVDVRNGARRIYSPSEGAGYVWCDGTGGVPLLKVDNGGEGGNRRETVMSYPVFVTRLGTMVDFRNGIWEKGAYSGRGLCFINMAALNHHSISCGATMAVKNYMGICDMSGGLDPFHDGKMIGNYYNFHSFAINEHKRGPVRGALGIALGTFMREIRRADMNFITAEWTGLASRTEGPVAKTQTILASADPVALDYHASKCLLYANSHASLHDPDNENGPFHQYLSSCAGCGAGVFDERQVAVQGFDCATNRAEDNAKTPIMGKIAWGRHAKSLFKHFLFRVL
jgi:hypothetical protein